MTTSAVQSLVDTALEQTWAAHPEAECSITLSRENSLLLPLHARQVHRVVESRLGYYGGHVYRDCLVWDVAGMEDWLVVVTAVGTGAVYYGDLRTNAVSLTLPSFLEREN